MKVKSESEVAQSCPTLSDPIDYSPPGSSVHGIFQARVLEWGAIAFSASNATEVQSLLSSLKKVSLKKKKKKKEKHLSREAAISLLELLLLGWDRNVCFLLNRSVIVFLS